MAREIIPSSFKIEFEKILNRKYFSKKVHQIRKNAFDNLLERGLPNRKWEDWRFTNLSSIHQGGFRLSEQKDNHTKKLDLSKYGFDTFYSIVIYNGHLQKDISSIPDGIQILSHIDYMKKNDWEVNHPKISSFDLMNTAFMDSGICIIIEKGKTIDIPIRLLFISSKNEKLMVSPRIYIDLEESSSLKLLEQHVGDCGEYFLNVSTIINISENANLEHIRIQNNTRKTINMTNVHIEQHENSIYSFLQFVFGSILGRLNMYTNLNGKDSDCHLNGVNLSKNGQHLDNHVITNHHAPHCNSSQNFKSVLKNKSSGVFNGRTIVHHGADKTDSHQSNKNLLLSKKANMNSNPQLEIYTDDVKCSHGSSTGELESDAIFYMQSRGIDMTTAKGLLVRGFVSEIIDMIDNKDIQHYVINQFEDWIKEKN